MSSEVCPWIDHDEFLSCFRAPIKATHQAIGTGGTVIHFEEQWSLPPRTTLKLTNLPSPSVSIILLFASSNLSLSLRLLKTVLVPANLSRGTHFLWNFFCFFFLARRGNQCVRWTRNTNKTRRALSERVKRGQQRQISGHNAKAQERKFDRGDQVFVKNFSSTNPATYGCLLLLRISADQ